MTTNQGNWDRKLPFVLFAYRTSPQESTGYSPFYLLYGRDPVLPTEEVLMPAPDQTPVLISEYAEEVAESLQEAWTLARTSVQKAQKKQKASHDRRAATPTYQVGDQVRIFMPAEKQGKNRKFARPYKGPFEVVYVSDTGAEVKEMHRPRAKPFRVAWNRVFPFVSDDSGDREPVRPVGVSEPDDTQTKDSSSWENRLRKRPRSSPRVGRLVVADEDVSTQDGGGETTVTSTCAATDLLQAVGDSPKSTCSLYQLDYPMLPSNHLLANPITHSQLRHMQPLP